MEKFLSATRRFLRDEEGVTAIEYGMIAALVAVFLIASLVVLGGGLDGLFRRVAACLDGVC